MRKVKGRWRDIMTSLADGNFDDGRRWRLAQSHVLGVSQSSANWSDVAAEQRQACDRPCTCPPPKRQGKVMDSDGGLLKGTGATEWTLWRRRERPRL